MDRRNLLIASGLIGAIIVLLSTGVLILSNIVDLESSMMASTIGEDPTTAQDGLTYFNNSTPEATAVSTAQLIKGVNGFYGYPDRVYLTSDGKYWMVHVLGSYVTVDAKTGMTKEENREWKSLDELKASYIADVQRDVEEELGKPQKITVDGKEIWKVPIHEYIDSYSSEEGPTAYIRNEPCGFIYVDLETGKSKREVSYEDAIFNLLTGTDGWLTLKQIDSICNRWPYPFRNALRNLYSK